MPLTTYSGLAKICQNSSEEDHDEGLPVLWQVLTKQHLAPDATLEEWVAFVHQYENSFADDVSSLGKGYWNQRDLTAEEIEEANDEDFEE